MSTGISYAGTAVETFLNGSNAYSVTENQGLQIHGADGTCAAYAIDPTGRTYTYQSGSTAANLLSNINGNLLVVSSSTLSFPLPIASFVWDNTTYTFSSIQWNQAALSSGTNGMYWQYAPASSTTTTVSALADFSGNLAQMSLALGSSNNKCTIGPGSNAYTYNIISTSGHSVFGSFNGVPYGILGSTLMPEGPISTFAYEGTGYSFTGFTQSNDGNWIAQYATASGGSTATVEYSPTNDALVKWSIIPQVGQTAVYVDGAAVGQPGAYVWNNTSTALNGLSSVNGISFTESGSTSGSAVPTTTQNASGIFEIQGNYMSLGKWFNNTSQAGLNIAYYDGQNAPATIEFAASRPSNNWLWDATTASGTTVTPIMQLDDTNRLLLYPVAGSNANAGAAGTNPAVILDPNGTSRFDGPVRIAPQGDLQMGTFISEPAQ